jgi:exo-1,4-beta-D-glucosaminidase
MPVGLSDDGEPQWHWRCEPFYYETIKSVTHQMFRSELGQAALPVISSLKKFITNAGDDKNNPLFPLDSVWAEHGAWDSDDFAYKGYHDEITRRYGKPDNIEDYARKAQFINADGYRAMYEAANHRMWDITSGVMLWKLNDCSTSVSWQMYDWYLNPNAGYYFAKKACEPLHIQLNADDHKISVINRYHRNFSNIKYAAKVYDSDMNIKWKEEKTINVGEDRYIEISAIPKLKDITNVFFVKLELLNEEGNLLSSNFYWQSVKTPADMAELANSEKMKPEIKYNIEKSGLEYTVKVKIKNKTKKLSFFNRLSVIRNDTATEILPSFWEDNFITLFPGEERSVDVKFAKDDAGISGISVIAEN